MSPTPLEKARNGDLKAIAYLINRSLQSKGIKATVEMDNGCLEVMLDATTAPPDIAIASFIRNGLEKLDIGIEPRYV